MRRPAFKVALDPFARMYEEFFQQMAAHVKVLTDDELREVIRARREVSETNCSWSAYAVAPIVEDEARRELYSREKAATEGAAGPAKENAS